MSTMLLINEVQSNFNGSNPDDSFTLAVSNLRSPGGDIMIHIMICFPRNAFHSHVICISFP